MPESYTSGPNRVIIRHKGPAGRGIPAGGSVGQIIVKSGIDDYETSWAEAPDGTDAVVFTGAVPANNELVLFSGATGKIVKRSSILASTLAFIGDLATKVDVDGAKVLSANDFTNVLKTKLDNLASEGFRGNFADLTAVNAFSFSPLPAVGDYVTVASPDFARYWWNPNGTPAWAIETEEYVPDEAALAALIFIDGAGWTQPDCQIFTPAYAAKIDELDAIIDALGFSTSSTTPKGFASYFNLTGQLVPITTLSDGTNNFVLIDPATAVSGASNEFTGGVGSFGRLEYTGLATRTFAVRATIAHSGTSGDVSVFAIAKNGVVISESRTMDEIKAANEITQGEVSCLVSLVTGDYIEVFVANATSTDDVRIHALNLSAVIA